MNSSNNDHCDVLFVHDEKVDRIRSLLASSEVISKMADLFKALQDPTRLRIILALQEEELCVCDLSALTGLPQSSVSHHLQALRKSNLVRNRKQGKMSFYQLSDHHVNALLAVSRDHASE